MYLQSPRRMCAPIHKRPPFRSRMRPAIISARPRIFGVKINEFTTIAANLAREGSSEKRIAPFRKECWAEYHPCESETVYLRVYDKDESLRRVPQRRHPGDNNHL